MVDDILPLRQAKSRNRNLIFGINDSYSHLSSIRHDKLVNGSQCQSWITLEGIWILNLSLAIPDTLSL